MERLLYGSPVKSLSKNSHWKDQKSIDSGFVADTELSESFEDYQDQQQNQQEDSPLASLSSLTCHDADYKDLPTDSSSVKEALRVIEELSASHKNDMVFTQQDSHSQGWIKLIAQKQASIIELEQEFETIQTEKEKVKKESVFAMQQHETKMRIKSAEMKRLRDEMKSHKQCLSSLAKSNQEQREQYELKIKCAKEKLEIEEKELEGSEIEIIGKMKAVLTMRGKEERLKRRLAEANLSMSKVENALRKIERDNFV